MYFQFEPLPFSADKEKMRHSFGASDYDRLWLETLQGNRYTIQEKAIITNLKYSDLAQLTREAELHMHKVVSNTLNLVLEDKECGEPFDLNTTLAHLQIPLNEVKFQKQLRLKKVPYKYLLTLAQHIADEYKIKED